MSNINVSVPQITIGDVSDFLREVKRREIELLEKTDRDGNLFLAKAKALGEKIARDCIDLSPRIGNRNNLLSVDAMRLYFEVMELWRKLLIKYPQLQ